MARQTDHVTRRRFLTAAAPAVATLAIPQIVPRSVLGRGNTVPPSDQILIAGIGIGGRGSGVLAEFLGQPDVRCVAVCDAQADRRQRVKKIVDDRYGNQDCASYRDFRDLFARDDLDAVLITTGSNNHGLLSIYAARAGKDVYCEKPCTKTIAESLALAETFRRTGRVYQGGMQRRNVPNFELAVALARSGKLGQLRVVHAHPGGMATGTSGWPAPEPEPGQDEVDWDLFLGTAAWRPFNRRLLNSHFEKGGGLVGGGVLEWGSHCVDLCQWANDADDTVPVEYHPVIDGRVCARYANGVQLVMRHDGWLPLGSCPVRFEGDAGWIETGDSGKFDVSSQSLLLSTPPGEIGLRPRVSHVRDFLNCVKSRGKPRVNADVACQSHIACHAANIAIFLGRTLDYDPVNHEFLGDEPANRLRDEAAREPWRVY
jgi:predicted dehydrogenase